MLYLKSDVLILVDVFRKKYPTFFETSGYDHELKIYFITTDSEKWAENYLNKLTKFIGGNKKKHHTVS